jgi:hypothetical protein
MCFACHGAGGKLTPAGKRARARHDQLCRERLTVPRDDVQVGARVYDRLASGWQWFTVDERRIWEEPGTGVRHLHLTTHLPGGRWTGTNSAIGRGRTIMAWDPAIVAGIYNEVARLKGATLRPADLPNDVSTHAIGGVREATPVRAREREQ